MPARKQDRPNVRRVKLVRGKLKRHSSGKTDNIVTKIIDVTMMHV